MTLNDINKALSQLTQQPSRENILEFSFMLLNWMDVSANAESKPQLLSPQTQKLKDYLVNAPQTVQPQLYRLSADGQNIRVRFAVLKKLKKEYISQLVDNDPGLSSYQSFSKGLNLPANGTSFIPNQPYYIHFVTTADYNKLVLIFNQGEQKRIVSFRNRLTNTQYHKIIQAWQNIGVKSKPEIADLFWKSLDIKEVNKEFYRQIKERFDALIGIVKTQPSTATENQVKQFTVRMIGRYVFCWFLKEKEIIPHSLISKHTIENTDNYYQTVLLKLFFETLNTKVQDRDPAKHNKLFEKIPYLNGGLFDESEEDKLFSNLNLDEWLLPFVDILESYDFTVDESSSQYQQVAVDPEMLGRIFENLLASQNEETEKLANQRKAFGAFYTPREIVDYMVNESIKVFLQYQWEQHIEAEKTKHLNNPEALGDIFGKKKPQQLAIETKRYQLKQEEKEKIEKHLSPLFSIQPHTDGLKKEDKILLLSFLERIKILDPACGSGAFPMGILHKLLELHEILGTVKSSYELKKDILSENIYGVDIMPMAIEIARLRAWLSLVLEEDYKPNDPKHNFGVKPLPNLDFKFVCANSLIDLGLDDFIKESKGTLHEGFTKKLVTDLKDLEAMRTNFFNPSLASSQKEQLKTDYLEKRDKVVSNIELDSDTVLKQIAQKIKNWNPFDDSQPSAFFSPTWMFGIDRGFDVVIGNPPYVGEKGHSAIFEALKSVPKWATFYRRRSNTYYFFIKLGLDFLKKGGVQCLIVPREFTSADWSNKVRMEIIQKSALIEIVDFSDTKVFEDAGTSSLILTHQKVSISKYDFGLKIIPKEYDIRSALLDKSINLTIPIEKITSENYRPWNFHSDRLNYAKKLVPLGSLFHISQGLVTGADRVTPKHIRKGLVDKAYLGRGIFILEEGIDIRFEGDNSFIKINFEWLKLDESDKKCIQPYYKPEYLSKWNVNKTSLFVIYAGKNLLSKNIINYLYQFRNILVNRSTTIGDKSISFNDFEKYSLDEIKKYYSSAGAVQKVMRRKEWYLPLYDRTNIPFDGLKIIVNTKNMNVFTYSSSPLYSSGGGSGGQNYIYPDESVDFIKTLTAEKMLDAYTMFINAVLNSKLIQARIKSSNFNQLSTSKLADIPIPLIDFSDDHQLDIFNKITERCKILLQSNQSQSIRLDREKEKFVDVERMIDVSVYKLYELSYTDVKVIDKDFWLSEQEYENVNVAN